LATVIVLPGPWPEDAKGARQLAVCAPGPLPVQLHDHGPLPDTLEAVPDEHRLPEGAEVTARPLALPHEPLLTSWAEHSAVEPPLAPAQFHDHGPLPETLEALPAEHRLLEGAEVTSVPLALPQAPLTAALLTGAEHCAVVPRLVPAQLQDHGPAPETLDAVPAEHKFLVGFEVTATSSALPQLPLTDLRCAAAGVLPASMPKSVGEYAGNVATVTKSTAKT
jgi:hypothetical protein